MCIRSLMIKLRKLVLYFRRLSLPYQRCLDSFSQYMHPPGAKQNSTINSPPQPFSYLEHVFTAVENAVMAKVIELIKTYLESLIPFRRTLRNNGKQKKKKSKWSHRPHSRSQIWSQSRSRPTLRHLTSPWEGSSQRDSPLNGRSILPLPRRGTCGHPDNQK